MSNLVELVAAIEALTPAERRRLQKRLHASGLFVVEELLSDREKLARATAVRIPATEPDPPLAPLPAARSFVPASGTPSHTTQPKSAKNVPPLPPIEPEIAPPPPAGPRQSGAGKVVLGPPKPSERDPWQMAPLPGVPPASPIQVIFDGGSRGNPGEGYGSYQVRWEGNPPQTVRLNFGNNYTNNEAEYDTLIAALEAILKRLRDMQVEASLARVEIRGDSLLVVNQVTGVWKVKDARMEGRRDKVRALLRQFAGWSLTHHDRSNSVRELGH